LHQVAHLVGALSGHRDSVTQGGLSWQSRRQPVRDIWPGPWTSGTYKPTARPRAGPGCAADHRTDEAVPQTAYEVDGSGNTRRPGAGL